MMKKKIYLIILFKEIVKIKYFLNKLFQRFNILVVVFE